MKILTNEKIKNLDQHTILSQSISSEVLMERAGSVFTSWFCSKVPDVNQPICVYCGTGNNGGDGLVIGRLLLQKSYRVKFIICHLSHTQSSDFQVNLKKLDRLHDYSLLHIHSDGSMHLPGEDELVIDAILGSGLNKPLPPFWQELVKQINRYARQTYAVDIPTGLYADIHTPHEAIEADYTMAFQVPKKAFFFRENQNYVGDWILGSIDLDPTYLAQQPCTSFTLDREQIIPNLKKRKPFDHKGTFGHALTIAGSKGKAGAAVLAAKSSLRAGAGLSTVLTAGKVTSVIHSSVNEIMCMSDNDEDIISSLHQDFTPFDAIGIGPGLGLEELTAAALKRFLSEWKHKSMVLDADALNIISLHHWHHLIPPGAILTPHPKEFERLFGSVAHDFQRHELQIQMAIQYNCIIILKGGFTCIALPDGRNYFNLSGNPGMATAGSGDVLTGVITGFLAQGYSPEDSATTAVFLHGLAGDLAARDLSQEAIIAGDIVDYLGKAFNFLHAQEKTSIGSFYRRWNF